MPFFVEYSTKRRTIAISGASPVQFIICDALGTVIHLEAFLNDYINHRNVTFTWEQIKGDPVILSSTDTVTTSFEYSETSDKVFRFYIDKDTPRESYIDCRVYHTPISFYKQGFNVHSHYGTSIAYIDSKQFAIKTPGYSRTIDPDVDLVPAEELTFSYIIDPTNTIYADKIEVYYSPNATLTPYILKETWTGSFPTTYVAEKGYYALVLYVTYPNGVSKQYVSHIFVSNPPDANPDELTKAVDDLHKPGYMVKLGGILRYTYIVQSQVEPSQVGVGSSVNLDMVTRYGNVGQSVLMEWSNHIFMGYTVQASNLNRTNPGGIGS